MAKRKSWTIIAAILLSLFGARLFAAENTVSSPADVPVSPATTLSSSVSPATVPQKLEPSAASVPAAEGKPGRAEEVKPVLFFLPDKDGKLQAVFDFGYEDFVELYKLKKQLERKEQRPRYTLEKLAVEGKAEDSRAELTVRLQITQHDADWVRIPLRLDQALLLDPAEYKGGGKMIAQFVGAGEGYVAWLRGEAGATHELKMRISAPIANAGADRKLKLFLPRASISEFELAVAENSVAVQATEGATASPPTVLPSGGSKISLRGASGDFELVWRKADAAEAASIAALEAVGSILARFDDRGISTEAALTLRSYGAPFDRVVVRLPEGAEWTPSTNAAYAISPIAGDDKSGDSRRQVEVRFPKKILGPVEVLLACRRQFETKNPPAWQELAGFEVLGATRQWGILAAATSGDWQILWGDGNGVQQVDQLPDKLRVAGLAAGFEYFSQPFSIQSRLNPRRTRINVEPEYLLLVDRDRLRLDSKLSYTIHGAKAHSLKIFMPDWQLDRIEPENLISAEGVDLDENGMLTIPLLEPASGTIELRLKAVQSLAPGTKAIAVGMPQPMGASSISAALAVSPADNIELTPNSTTSVGLIRQQTALPLKLPERRQEPLFYRSEGKAAMFAADLNIHSRRISCELLDRVRIDERSLQVEQKLAYRIEYEATDHLFVDVPNSLAENPSLAFEHEGKPLTAKPIARDDADAAPAGMVRMHVALPEACLGECAVAVRFSQAMPALQAVKAVVEAIPLAVPAEGAVLGNRLQVISSPGVKASPSKKIWMPVEREPLSDGQSGTTSIFKTDGRVDRVLLDLGKEETSGLFATVVDRVWIQTWLTPSARQDRVTYQILTNQSELNLKMPAGAAVRTMVAVLDGKPVVFRSLGNQRLSIPLPSDGEMRRYHLDIIYNFTDTESLPLRLDLAFPQIGSGVWNRRIYWQLILPQNRHVIAEPKGFASEYRWDFSGFFWGRQPQMSQEELETWAGASHRPAPPQGMNVYLFSSLGYVEGASVRTAARLWLVLGSSGIALLVGLLMIYFPILRHPASLLTLALALLSLGLIYPEPTVLLGQTSCLGLVLALVAGLFARYFPERRKRVVEPPAIKPEIPSAKSPNLAPISVVSVATTENRPTLLE